MVVAAVDGAGAGRMIAFDCTLRRDEFVLDVAFEAGKGVTALFGPSGSGKTTVMQLLAGLARPDRGMIRLGDTVLTDTASGFFLPPHKRHIGLVFQDAQLFPHLSVRQNLLYGRFFAPLGERRINFDNVVAVLGLDHCLKQFPATLSGGEKQRVAIGRALLSQPHLLLMDEPLASLDMARKLEILAFIERLHGLFAIPIIYVSHAVEEVVRLASHVVRLEKGKVVAAGPTAEVMAATAFNRAGERFDVVSSLSATVLRHLPDYGLTVLKHPAGELVVPGHVLSSGGAVRLAVRATGVTLALGKPSQTSVRTVLSGSVMQIERDEGPFALASVGLKGGDVLYASITRQALDDLGLDVGDEVFALVKAVTLDERGIGGFQVTPS